MNCEVSVYYFRTPDECAECQDTDPAPFVMLSIELGLVATVEIEATGLSAKEVAVRAWIEAVGRERQSLLIELIAPTVVIEAQVDPLHQSDYVREAPEHLSHLGGLYQFILDNGWESWLIKLSSDWSPDPRFSTFAATKAARQGSRFSIAAAPGDGHAAIRSLWQPRLN